MKELKPGGKDIKVNNENKYEYFEKLVFFQMYQNVKEQVDAFLTGFHELVPKELISIFNYRELELLIAGLPNFDLEDLKQNTDFDGYTRNSP